jgi:hypothetical protein
VTNLTPFFERLQAAFTPTDRGVAGAVDHLLDTCRGQGVCLDWQAGACHVRPLNSAGQESLQIPLAKSVFRAVLARVAALCNERTPNSVSPYGGHGELEFGAGPPAVFRAAFTNSPGEQRLELMPIRSDFVAAEKREFDRSESVTAHQKV